MSAAPGKGNRPVFVVLGIAAWVGVIAGSIFLAARIGLRNAPAEAFPPPSALAPSDPGEIARALSRADSPVKVESVPGHPSQFQVTRKETGETVVLDLQALQKLAALEDKGDPSGVAKLFPRTPAAGALSGEEAPPLPEWVPLPPGARVTAHAAAASDGGAGTFIVSVPQSPAQAGRFYESRLQGEGYAVTRNEIVGGATAGTVFTATLDGPEALRRTLQLILTRDGARTQVVGTYGTGAEAAP